jgi:ketosteroid isomerase-like protein
MDTQELLLMQNARFYEAFEQADMEAMAALWSHDDRVRCVHPGWGMTAGWDAVRKSWESIFGSGTALRFSLRNVDARAYDRVGVVSLLEEIILSGDAVRQTVQAAATNIFAFDGAEWKLIVHHSSPVLAAKDDDLTYRFN